jgi:hypothetical protein
MPSICSRSWAVGRAGHASEGRARSQPASGGAPEGRAAPRRQARPVRGPGGGGPGQGFEPAWRQRPKPRALLIRRGAGKAGGTAPRPTLQLVRHQAAAVHSEDPPLQLLQVLCGQGHGLGWGRVRGQGSGSGGFGVWFSGPREASRGGARGRPQVCFGLQRGFAERGPWCCSEAAGSDRRPPTRGPFAARRLEGGGPARARAAAVQTSNPPRPAGPNRGTHAKRLPLGPQHDWPHWLRHAWFHRGGGALGFAGLEAPRRGKGRGCGGRRQTAQQPAAPRNRRGSAPQPG